MVYLKRLFKAFPENSHSLLGILGELPWGIISSKATGSISAVLVNVGFFVGVSQVFCLFSYLLCEQLPLVAAA